MYHFLYTDDGVLVGCGPNFHVPILMSLLLFGALEIPLTWKKLRGGLSLEWVGLVLDVKDFRIGFTQRRVEWARSFCEAVASGQPVLVRHLREGLGRLIFLAGPSCKSGPSWARSSRGWPPRLPRPASCRPCSSGKCCCGSSRCWSASPGG